MDLVFKSNKFQYLIEVQGYKDDYFIKRLTKYKIALYDRYLKRVTEYISKNGKTIKTTKIEDIPVKAIVIYDKNYIGAT